MTRPTPEQLVYYRQRASSGGLLNSTQACELLAEIDYQAQDRDNWRETAQDAQRQIVALRASNAELRTICAIAEEALQLVMKADAAVDRARQLLEGSQ